MFWASAALANDGAEPASPEAPVAKAQMILGKKAEKKPAEWKPGLAGSILSSRFATQHQDVGEAAKYLSESLKRDPENEILQQQTMRAQLVAGNMPEAIAIAHALQPVAARDPLVATLLMIDAVKQGKPGEGKRAIAVPADRGLFGIIRPVMNEWLSIAADGLKAPVTMQAAIDKSGFFAPFLHYHAALMNDVLGFKDIALSHYEKSSVDMAVTPYRVVEALSNFYLRQEQPDKAQGVFDAYAHENPDSNLIPDRISGAGNDGKVKPLVASPAEGLAELFFSTASILFGEEMTNESFIYLRLALTLKPDLAPAQLMLASLYEGNQEYDQAIAIYESITPGTVFYKRARIRKALNVEAAGNREEAIHQLRQIADDYPKDEAALVTLGDLYREQERFEDASEAYGEAILRVGEPKESDWPLFYARGIAYERAGMWNAAERDFNQALALSPNQPEVLNYLGYSWLVMNKNLKKAREYIEVAYSARPDDAHILDSMGWAHFMMGEYDEAVTMLEKAADIMPQDVTVNEHLGDAYWKVGRRTEAAYQWKRALSFKPDAVDVERIEAKIADGLPEKGTKTQKVGHNDVAPVIGGEDAPAEVH